MLKIINAPSPILSEKAKEVKKIDKDILKLIEEMKKTLLSAKDPEGIGLAAPQVDRSLQIFLVKPTANSPIQTFINPVIIEDAQNKTKQNVKKQKNRGKITKLEGCLSLPNIWGAVLRKPTVVLSYLDETGKKRERKFTGFIATIIQHEIDHLKGDLFPKRVLEQKGELFKSHKDEENQDVFEEIEI